MNALRRTESKEARRANRQVAAWLNKGARLLNRLSSWPSGFENFREDVRRWARLYEDEEEEERKKWVRLTSIQHAEPKRVAAEAALHVCDEFAIKPTMRRWRAQKETVRRHRQRVKEEPTRSRRLLLSAALA